MNSFLRIPSNLSSFKKTATPDFSRSSTRTTLEGLVLLHQQDNAQSQVYTPNYEYIYRSQRVPNFRKILSREAIERSHAKLETPSHYDHERINKAFDSLSHLAKPASVIKFEKVQGRDDNLLYRLMEKPQTPMPDCVSYEQFLPNSIRCSPSKKAHSHTRIS